MKKIILDTNFLMIPCTLKVDIFAEFDRIMDDKYQLVVLDSSIRELDGIIENQPKFKSAAKFAKEAIKKKKVRIQKTDSDNPLDDLLVDLAKKHSYIFATQDKELKKRIRKFGRELIVLRQKNHLIRLR